MRQSLYDTVRTAVSAQRERRAIDRALRTALARFGAADPAWYASLFDATFVARLGVDAVLAGPPIEVARSWTLQFAYADERTRERDARGLVPVVERFSGLLRAALEEGGVAAPHWWTDRLAGRPCPASRDDALVPKPSTS